MLSRETLPKRLKLPKTEKIIHSFFLLFLKVVWFEISVSKHKKMLTYLFKSCFLPKTLSDIFLREQKQAEQLLQRHLGGKWPI
jgi:hypothetical protein